MFINMLYLYLMIISHHIPYLLFFLIDLLPFHEVEFNKFTIVVFIKIICFIYFNAIL